MTLHIHIICIYIRPCTVHTEAARKFNISAVNCNSVLRVTCPCFVCVCVL